MKTKEEVAAMAAASSGGDSAMSERAIHFRMDGGSTVDFRIGIFSLPKIGSGGTPPGPGPVPGTSWLLSQCLLGGGLGMEMWVTVAKTVDDEKEGQRHRQEIAIEADHGRNVVLNIEIASVPKIGGGGTPLPGPGRRAMLFSGLLGENLSTDIGVGVLAPMASVKVGGGGTPPISP